MYMYMIVHIQLMRMMPEAQICVSENGLGTGLGT